MYFVITFFARIPHRLPPTTTLSVSKFFDDLNQWPKKIRVIGGGLLRRISSCRSFFRDQLLQNILKSIFKLKNIFYFSYDDQLLGSDSAF